MARMSKVERVDILILYQEGPTFRTFLWVGDVVSVTVTVQHVWMGH